MSTYKLELTENDLAGIAGRLLVDVSTIRSAFADPKNLGRFKVEELKSIIRYLRDCGYNRLTLTGLKSELASRIVNSVYTIIPAATPAPSPAPAPSSSSYSLPPSQPSYTPASSSSSLPATSTYRPSSSTLAALSTQHAIPPPPRLASTPIPAPIIQHPFGNTQFDLRQSPFFEQISVIATHPFETYPHRCFFTLTQDHMHKIKNEAMRLHLRFFMPTQSADIPWNTDVSVTVNHRPVDSKPLARKIRSKTYSDPFIMVTPLDITAPAKLDMNTLEFSHPGVKGTVVVQLVRPRAPEAIASRVIRTPRQDPSRWLSSGQDDEIAEVNCNVSLRCPLSHARISLPAKGQHCKHIQCFDLMSYVSYCVQQQLWQCPVCNRSVPLHDLRIDSNFEDILQGAKHTDAQHVVLAPDGSWKVPAPVTAARKIAPTPSSMISLDDDDDEDMGVHTPTHTHAPTPTYTHAHAPSPVLSRMPVSVPKQHTIVIIDSDDDS
eukprot:TRINITY_DN7136_c0_g1_i3.p1 TRINITY_DN7136_c0_g1~~TRINITY_DN7136_c0_g1_i3.p1  ORF type:complete len:491 (+),score=130.87 TRINITY_DN7136_c0_g1_i3:15-1487(+)